MELISSALLLAIFKQHDNFLVTKNKLEITLEDNGEVSATRAIWTTHDSICLDLVCNYPNLNSFIEAATIESIEDLHNVPADCCWSCYLSGKGYVSATMLEFDDIEVDFRVSNLVTAISSLDLNFYDEVEYVFSAPNHFIDYIDAQWLQRPYLRSDIERFRLLKS
jgi:hypothetical protein